MYFHKNFGSFSQILLVNVFTANWNDNWITYKIKEINKNKQPTSLRLMVLEESSEYRTAVICEKNLKRCCKHTSYFNS